MDFTYKTRITPPNQKVLEIIEAAWEEERESEVSIRRLTILAKDSADKETLRMLRMDEHKHIKYFAEIYKRLSSKSLPQDARATPRSLSWNFSLECEKLMHKSMDNVEFYRRLYIGFNDQETRDTLFEIITDEMNMAIRMTHMCNKNREFF